MTRMKEDEPVSEYLLHLVLITNQIKVCGELINYLQNIEKVLRSLTANFDYIVVSIEESKNLAKMKLEEIQASLEYHNMRFKQRNSERKKIVEREIQARFIKKTGKEKAKQRRNLSNDDKSSKNANNQYDSIKKDTSNKYSRKNVVVKKSNTKETNMWYLDSGCSNDMTGADESEIRRVKLKLRHESEKSDLWNQSYFLGIEFKDTSEGVFLNQKKYFKDILKRFKMRNYNSVATSLETGAKLRKETNDEFLSVTLYKQISGSLKYIFNTRPDICQSVILLSRFIEKPQECHLTTVKRVLRYIKATIDHGVLMPKKKKTNINA
ncbi:uncharacterized protein LOC127079150 [Lathyrus oleraceus]|uniref:uncharacterized protein LOC127079150 n=1 Tax=Pisum sativum TaxID=3888 RepID=UPI0021D0E20D|nr:uncharacterized protein LOC127079150 [Pisum sativum]